MKTQKQSVKSKDFIALNKIRMFSPEVQNQRNGLAVGKKWRMHSNPRTPATHADSQGQNSRFVR